jgi:hypothetical protein
VGAFSGRERAPNPKIDMFKAALNLPDVVAATTLNLQYSTRATQLSSFKRRHIQNSDATDSKMPQVQQESNGQEQARKVSSIMQGDGAREPPPSPSSGVTTRSASFASAA